MDFFTDRARRGVAFANAIAVHRGAGMLYGVHLVYGMSLCLDRHQLGADLNELMQLAVNAAASATPLKFDVEVRSAMSLLERHCENMHEDERAISVGDVLLALYCVCNAATHSAYLAIRIDIDSLKASSKFTHPRLGKSP